jgi:di/tricarboxylate transporter
LNALNIIIIVVSITIAGVTSLILSKIYKDKEKVDKGFELIYSNLTHRRKMIRALSSLPIIIIGLIIIYYFSDWSLAFFIIFVLFVLLTLSLQFIYNFKKWKNEEKSY